MSIANLFLALILAAPPDATEPAPASSPAPQPVAQPQPAAQPQPVAEPQPAAQPQPVAEPQPAPTYATQPQPAPTYATQPQPAPAYEVPPSTGPVPLGPHRTGVGLLVAGPLTVAVGIPFSLLGNMAWRDNCGPNSSNRECADGTFASVASHTITGVAFGGGIAMTAVGAARRGQFDAAQDPTRSGVGFIVGGAVLLPSALIGMGMARLFFWLPTPDCLTYSCVERYQHLSTLTVGGLALAASMGAGLLMYGTSYNRARPRFPSHVAVLPRIGRGFSGLSLTGQF